MPSTALVVVATPGVYSDMAQRLFESATTYFHPTGEVTHVLLEADSRPWPYPTLMRHRILLTNLPEAEYVFMCDADAVFEGPVGPEILPLRNLGITATQHPGYVGKHPEELPYERRPDHAACLRPEEGSQYFCGGFFGGTWEGMRGHLLQTSTLIETDLAEGRVSVWHDESAHNHILAHTEPSLVLGPDYAHPDRDEYYVAEVWGRQIPRRLVMLDQPAEMRVGRAA